MNVADIVVVPAERPQTRPACVKLPTMTIALPTEDQAASLVQSCVLLSLKVQVAVSCTVVPLAIEGLGGVTTIEDKVAAVTVTVAEP